MDSTQQAISNDLQTQWQDHFHMRDQTWKVLQYSIQKFGFTVIDRKDSPVMIAQLDKNS